MTRILVLVGCSGGKVNVPSETRMPARDLYTGPLFRKSRAYAEQTGDRWAILSGLWGLLMPDRPIKPYDYQLANPGTYEHGQLAKQVAGSMIWEFGKPDCVDFWPDDIDTIVLAGKRYAALVPSWAKPICPLEGLGIGQRLAYLNERIAR